MARLAGKIEEVSEVGGAGFTSLGQIRVCSALVFTTVGQFRDFSPVFRVFLGISTPSL